MTIQQCFQTAAQVQILLRDLHSGLARCFGEDPVLRETFIFLSREEEQRVLRLRLLVKDRKGVLWSDEAIGTIHSNVVAIWRSSPRWPWKSRGIPKGSPRSPSCVG